MCCVIVAVRRIATILRDLTPIVYSIMFSDSWLATVNQNIAIALKKPSTIT